MKLTDFDALSFDCYGTLIDWETGFATVLTPWAKSRGLDVDEEELLVRYAAHEARTARTYPEMLYPEVVARSFTDLGKELGADVTSAEATALGSSVPDWPAFEDSTAALADLSAHYQLIILSNVDRHSFEGSRRRLGIEFDAVVTAEDVGSYKPDPRNFAALRARIVEMGIQPERLLHVAQSLFHDHVPATEAGLRTAWINRRHDRSGWGATPPPPSTPDPDWEFPSMAAFADACKQAHSVAP